ncbi:hypothetical protein OGAPHI_007393 [Ogataea philodendri]|uniref:Intracellular protein transport protein USO1 n=1 Tax=Ogataea philodendri TaxID=1378263 RepID=A0A9P8NTQ2_9ASCO|nr:uncharacterized protein OGAPHI_007393 [Ogataea philodendri]KAH3660188.1 hypothetical protein OGAPHI_007393 [Ogataea philodendri]
MELLQNFMSTPSASEKEVNDSITTLVDRLSHSTLLTDRRAAVLGLKSFSRQYREIVIANGLKSLVSTLHKDVLDLDIVKAVLETLLILFIRGEGDEDRTRSWISQQSRLKNGKYPSPSLLMENVTDQFSLWIFDELTQSVKSFDILVDLVEVNDIHIKLYSLQLLQALCSTRPIRTKELILKSPLAISKLCQVLDDPYEPIRNEAILLLMGVVKDNFNIQKLVVFENTFDKLYKIIEEEGGIEGNIVVQDCLSLISNLLRYNASNQKFFVETNCMYKLAEFLNQPLSESELGPFVWNEQRLQNLITTLDTCRLFVADGVEAIAQAQLGLVKSDVLMLILRLVFSLSVPNIVRVHSLLTTADIIRSNSEIQLQFSQIDVPYLDPTLPAAAQRMEEVVPVIDALLHWSLYANSVHLFDLRMASAMVLHAYFMDNEDAKYAFLKDQKYEFNKMNGVPNSEDEEDEESGQSSEEETNGANGAAEENGESRSPSVSLTGANLFETLINVDSELQLNPYKVWFASLILLYVFEDYSEGRELAMTIQIGNASANEDVLNIIEAIGQALCSSLRFKDPRVSIAYSMLLSVWLWENFKAVDLFLHDPSILDQLLAHLVESSNENQLVQGIIVILLAIVYEFSRKSSPVGRQQLNLLLKSRIGEHAFSLKVQQFEKSDAFVNFDDEDLLTPERDDTGLPQVYFDGIFVKLVKDNSRRLRGAVGHDPSFDPLETLSFEAFETVQNDCLKLSESLKSLREESDSLIEKQQAEIKRLVSEYDELAKNFESSRSELEKIQNDKELLDSNYAKTTGDFSKLTELKQELEKNLGSLTGQHQEAVSKISTLEIENKQLTERLNSIDQQKSKAEDGINKMSRELMQLTREKENQTKTVKNMEKEAAKQVKAQEKLKQQISQLEGTITSLESQIKSLVAEKKRGDDNYGSLRKSYEETVAKLKATEKEVELSRGNHSEATRSLEILKKESEESTSSLRSQLMTLTSQKGELEALNEQTLTQLAELRKESEKFKKEAQEQHEKLLREKEELEAAHLKEKEAWKDENAKFQEEKASEIENLEKKIKSLTESKNDISAVQKKLVDVQNEKEACEKTIASLKAELGETRELKNTATEEKKSLESTISMISVNVDAKDEECRRLMKEKEQLKKEKDDLSKETKDKIVELEALKKKVSELEKATKDLSSHSETIESLKSELAEKETLKTQAVSDVEKIVEKLRGELESKGKEIEKERELLSGNSEAIVKEYSEKITGLEEKVRELESQRESEVQKLKDEVKTLTSSQTKHNKDTTKQKKELEDLKQKHADFEKQAKQKEEELAGKASEVDSLKQKMKEQLRELIDLKKEKKEMDKLKEQSKELEKHKERTSDYEALEDHKNKTSDYDEVKKKVSEYEQFKEKVADYDDLKKKAFEYEELQKKVADYDELKAQAAEAESLKKQLTDQEQLQKQVLELEAKLKSTETKLEEMVPKGDLDDLMLLMSELDEKNKEMKTKLKSLGEEVSDMSDEESDEE